MTWPNDIQSNTPAKYQFKLIGSTGSVICDKEPIEWESGVIELNRDLEVGGIFSSFILDSLTLVGNGAELLKELWETDEFNAECVLVISWFKNSTRQYVEMPSRFKINFRNYQIVKVGNFAFGVRVNAINSSTQTKLDNRKGINIDITKLVSIGGYNIVDYPDLLKDFRFGEINAYRTAKHEYNNDVTVNDADGIFTIQQNLILSDFTESEFISFVTNQTLNKNMGFFLAATEDRILNIEIEIDVEIPEQLDNADFEFWYAILDSGDNIIFNKKLETIDRPSGTGIINITYSRVETLLAGNSIVIYGDAFEDPDPGEPDDIIIKRVLIEYNEGVITSDPVTVEAFPVYEAGERLCQHILDSQYPFYSEFLGRLDTPYNLNGDFYLSENQLRFASIMSGLNLRGLSLANINNPLAISFDKYFKSIKAWWNVGYTLETIDDFERIRFENYDFFFEDSVALDLSDRINKYDIVSEAMPEIAYLSLISGYNEFDYEEINGRGEYNSKNERSSIIATDSVFDNVSAFRGDTKGITLQLERSVTSDGTKDEKEDNKTFMVKSQRSAELDEDWKAETDENITVDNNTSLFQEGSLNLYSTPTRNLIRNSNRITPAYQKMLSSKLRFQISGKLQTLETTGEGYTVVENEDLIINNLNTPLYKAIAHTVDVQFDFDDLEIIKANQGKLIRFTSELTGYLLNLKKKNNEDKATIKIIEKYV